MQWTERWTPSATALPRCRRRDPPYYVPEGDSPLSFQATAQLSARKRKFIRSLKCKRRFLTRRHHLRTGTVMTVQAAASKSCTAVSCLSLSSSSFETPSIGLSTRDGIKRTKCSSGEARNTEGQAHPIFAESERAPMAARASSDCVALRVPSAPHLTWRCVMKTLGFKIMCREGRSINRCRRHVGGRTRAALGRRPPACVTSSLAKQSQSSLSCCLGLSRICSRH